LLNCNNFYHKKFYICPLFQFKRSEIKLNFKYMKTLTFLGVLLTTSLLGYSQQVSRDKVVVEIGTGTW